MRTGKARIWSILLSTALLTACADEQADEKVLQESQEQISGEEIYNSYCIACHAEGPGHPGTMRLAIRLGEDKSVLTKRNDLQAENVKTVVRQGILLMPPFRPSEITDSELDALAAYLAKTNG